MSNQPKSVIKIGERRISHNDPAYFIAEIGSNFDGDLTRAKDLIHLAKEAGADAVKFQHYTAGSLVSDAGFNTLGDQKSHQASWKKSVFDTYDDASLDRNWTGTLKRTCDDAGVDFFTSPYSFELVDYVEQFVPAYKVGSGDITWTKIIEYMAKKDKPMLIACGASDDKDVVRALDSALKLNQEVVLLQCNTNYTVSRDNFRHIQLNVLERYKSLYPGIITGLSDHTPGHVSVLGAVAKGARVIEKHFTDSTDRPGPDHAFAMNPESWREMVERTRELEMCLGDGVKRIEDNELETVTLQRRCVRSARDLQAGSVITQDDLTMLRPCAQDGIPPFDAELLLGKEIQTNVLKGAHLTWEDFKG
jgi:N-acetylneuraminate synthase